MHKIIIAPFWAAVASPVVKVQPTGVADHGSTVNSYIDTNVPNRPSFTASTVFVVTWVDQTLTSGDSKTFQLVIVSNGYFTYAIFSYDNGAPTWTEDDEGMNPISGLLAHQRRSNLCWKTAATSDKDYQVSEMKLIIVGRLI